MLAQLCGIGSIRTDGLNLAKHWNNTIRALRDLGNYAFAYWCLYRLYKQPQHSAGSAIANNLQQTAFAILNWKWAAMLRQSTPVLQLIHEVRVPGAREASISFNPNLKFLSDGLIGALCAQHRLCSHGSCFDITSLGYLQDISCMDHQWRGVVADDGRAHRAQCSFWCMEKTASQQAHQCILRSQHSMPRWHGVTGQGIGGSWRVPSVLWLWWVLRSQRSMLGCHGVQRSTGWCSVAQRGRQSARTG